MGGIVPSERIEKCATKDCKRWVFAAQPRVDLGPGEVYHSDCYAREYPLPYFGWYMTSREVVDEALPLLSQAINQMFKVRRKVNYLRRDLNDRKAVRRILRLLEDESVPEWVREAYVVRVRDLFPEMKI